MQTASTATHKVLKLKHLPPLSSTATRLLELLADEDLSLELLSNVISQDPGISARILGVANSAYFGQTSPIHSVEEAVIRVLGLNMVRSL
ncbi:MAG: HDOD domain-containing protein, partial [Candidatus Thiodiazotropha sp. (ex Notomyrtea botanica)]|nr:HDOD domain-containing protein [Candidatus Thiodiazotropha sp. (ex Notomyrtea botanica)]